MGTPHTPRIEIPVLIDDAGLSPYAFRLYAHIKRKAGDDGSCYEGTRTIAEVCRMSVGQVSKAKAELRAAGLVTFEKRMTKGGLVDEIRVTDVWPQNYERYRSSVHCMNTSECVQGANTTPSTVQDVNASPVSVHTANTNTPETPRSVHMVNDSVHMVNERRSIEEDHSIAPVASDDAPARPPRTKKPKAVKPDEPPTPIAIRQAIADACAIDLDGGMATRGQVMSLNTEAKRIWTAAQAQGKAEAECVDAIRYVAGWIKRTVYPYSNGQPLKPAALLERWRAAMDAKPKTYANGTNGHHNGAMLEPIDEPNPYEARRLRRQAAAGGAS